MISPPHDILILAEQLHVPECSAGLDRPLNESDFVFYKETCEDSFKVIRNLMREMLSKHNEEGLSKTFKSNKLAFVHILILCGEHSALNDWCSCSSVKVVSEIESYLLQISGKFTVEELLVADDHFMFKNALIILRPKLLLSTWKCNPAAFLSYSWLLMQLKAPFLSEHLCDILPTALIASDDFEVSNRMKGLKCINHIVNNVTKASLEMYGQNEVILEGLRPILFHNEPDILEPLLECLLTLMRKMNVPHQSEKINRSQFDDIFDIILNNIDLEERNKCKILYLEKIPDMISVFRLNTLRHSRKLLDMVGRELNVEKPDYIKELLLEVLDATIKHCWPRFDEVTCRSVMLVLLKLIYDFCGNPMGNSNKSPDSGIIERIRKSFKLLKSTSENHMELIRNALRSSEELDEKFKIMVNFVLM